MDIVIRLGIVFVKYEDTFYYTTVSGHVLVLCELWGEVQNVIFMGSAIVKNVEGTFCVEFPFVRNGLYIIVGTCENALHNLTIVRRIQLYE